MGHLVLINVRMAANRLPKFWIPNWNLGLISPEVVSWDARKDFSQKNEREFGKNVEVMSIVMYDSINQQCLVNKGGGKGSVGNLLTQAWGWRQNLPAEQWASVYAHFCQSLSVFAASASSHAGIYSRRLFISKQASCLFAARGSKEVCVDNSLLFFSSHIIHFFSPSIFLSPHSPTSHPFVYWLSRLRNSWVEDCNTQASNYFGVSLFAFPLHLFGLCL